MKYLHIIIIFFLLAFIWNSWEYCDVCNVRVPIHVSGRSLSRVIIFLTAMQEKLHPCSLQFNWNVAESSYEKKRTRITEIIH